MPKITEKRAVAIEFTPEEFVKFKYWLSVLYNISQYRMSADDAAEFDAFYDDLPSFTA